MRFPGDENKGEKRPKKVRDQSNKKLKQKRQSINRFLTRADDGDVWVVDPHRRLVDALLLSQRPLRVHLGQKRKKKRARVEGAEGREERAAAFSEERGVKGREKREESFFFFV